MNYNIVHWFLMRNQIIKKNIIKIIFLILFVMIGLLPAVYLYADEKDQEKIPEEYIIKEKDTLWDISEKFLKDPFLWPYIWQNNDYISNPDLIYPGDKLLLKKIELPLLPEPEEKKEARVEVKKKISKSKTERITRPVTPALPEKIPVTSSFIFRSAGFITRENLQVGSIIESPLDHITLSKGDLVYTDIEPGKNDLIGKKYSIYRIVKMVKHPVTRKKMGFLINVVGELELKEFKEERSTALITSSYEDIAIKDFITDQIELEVPLIDPADQPPGKDIQGYIIEAKNELKGVGSGDIVYLDIGSKNGIVPGDRLVVLRIKEETSDLVFRKTVFQNSRRIIGELKVISAKNETAAALVSKSDQELNIGEKVEYKVTRTIK